MTRASWVVADRDGRRVRCGVMRAPCTYETLDGVRLAARVVPVNVARTRPVTVERRYRAPEAATFVRRGDIAARTGPAGRATTPLEDDLAASEPGTWCFRLVVPATRWSTRLVTADRCVRVRPTITVGWAGDITLGSRAYGRPPGDGSSVFSAVRHLLDAPDLTIGNYEGTLSHGGSPRCSGGALCFIFQGPPRMAFGLRAVGFDVMNLANNHGLDMGANARDQTVRAMTRAGIAVAGLPNRITVQQVADTRVAIVGFGFSPGTVHLDDHARVRRLVRRAGQLADVVIVVHHSGLEGPGGAHVPHGSDGGRGSTRRFTHVAIDAGADVVFGSGPHVVRGIEQRRGALAFYSTGNFAGWNNFNLAGPRGGSGVASVVLRHTGETVRGRYDGVRVVRPGLPVPDRSVLRRVIALTRSDFPRSGPVITSTGDIYVRGTVP